MDIDNEPNNEHNDHNDNMAKEAAQHNEDGYKAANDDENEDGYEAIDDAHDEDEAPIISEESESISNTGVDSNSIEITGVGGNELPKITGVEHDGVTGVTEQINDEPKLEDDHPIEAEMDPRYGPWSHEHDL
jgi:hypothetical protein